MKERTSAERVLYGYLPYSMRRRAICQYPIKVQGRIFFADIFIEDWNIVIEVDGGYHQNADQQRRDEERTKLLESLGLRVCRISNNDVFNQAKAQEFASKVSKMGKKPHLFKKINTVRSISIKSRQGRKYSKSKFKKAKAQIDEIMHGKMESIGVYPQTYQLSYKSKDKKISMSVWTSSMTIELNVNGKRQYLYNQTINDLIRLVSELVH